MATRQQNTHPMQTSVTLHARTAERVYASAVANIRLRTRRSQQTTCLPFHASSNHRNGHADDLSNRPACRLALDCTEHDRWLQCKTWAEGVTPGAFSRWYLPQLKCRGAIGSERFGVHT